MELSDQGITPSLANGLLYFTSSFDIFCADTLPLAIGLIIRVSQSGLTSKGVWEKILGIGKKGRFC